MFWHHEVCQTFYATNFLLLNLFAKCKWQYVIDPESWSISRERKHAGLLRWFQFLPSECNIAVSVTPGILNSWKSVTSPCLLILYKSAFYKNTIVMMCWECQAVYTCSEMTRLCWTHRLALLVSWYYIQCQLLLYVFKHIQTVHTNNVGQFLFQWSVGVANLPS